MPPEMTQYTLKTYYVKQYWKGYQCVAPTRCYSPQKG